MATALRVQEYETAERRLFERYGLEYRSHYFQLDNPRLRARIVDVGSGPPVLLVHGGGGVASGWVSLLPELKGYRMLAVDRPGCGLTEGFNYRGSDLRSHAVSFLEGALDALDLQTVPIVANSMGGLWSFWLALDKPERVSAVAQLGCPALILDTGAPFPMRLLGVRGLNQIMYALEPPSHKQMQRVFKRMGHLSEVMGRWSTELWECYVRAERLPAAKDGWLSLLERVLRLSGPLPGLSLHEDELRRIVQPALFVWGDNDAFGKPAVGSRAVDIMPRAKLEVVPGGHLPWLDEPKRVGELVAAFLAENAVTAES